MSDGDPPGKPGPDLTESVAGVINAALGVGTVLARTAAEVTSGGRAVPGPPGDGGQIAALVHYGVAALGNLVSLAGSAVGTASAPPTMSAAAPRGRPEVKPGGGLRIPLSIENPGTAPMLGLQPSLLRVEHEGVDATGLVPPGAVRFIPAELAVAPRDFEKLTVLIGVPDEAPPGDYRAVIGLGEGLGEVVIAFTVVALAGG